MREERRRREMENERMSEWLVKGENGGGREGREGGSQTQMEP